MSIKSTLSELFGGKINKRKLKHGSLATALTVLFIAAVVLINIVATMLFDRFPITLDLTENSIYSISKETEDYISGITSPVDITVMATEEEYKAISEYAVQCSELLKKYAQYNSNISVNYKNLLSNPDFVANYSHNLETGDIIIELANGEHDRVKVVSLVDIVNAVEDVAYQIPMMEAQHGAQYTHSMLQAYNYITSSNAEQAITGAIMAVTDANPITVGVLSYSGADDSSPAGLTDLLDKNGYVITEVDIRKEDIPAEVDVILIPAPKLDYTTAETSKIENWLLNGGELEKDMIYIASVEQAKTPNLDALLEKYGITVEYKAIHETNDRYYSTYSNYTFQMISTENYQDDVANTALPIMAPDARAITLRYDTTDGYYTNEAIVSSTQSAVLKDMYVEDEAWDIETATGKGTYNSMAVARYKALNQETHISRFTDILIIGSDLMLDPSLMNAAQYNNGDIMLSVINEMTGKTEGVTIISKVVSGKSFEITTANVRALTVTFAVIIPVAVLATGFVIWIRRRNK